MASSSHSHAPAEPKVPAELVARSRTDWHNFTRAMVFNCLGVAAVLILMLLIFKIL